MTYARPPEHGGNVSLCVSVLIATWQVWMVISLLFFFRSLSLSLSLASLFLGVPDLIGKGTVVDAWFSRTRDRGFQWIRQGTERTDRGGGANRWRRTRKKM